MGAFRWPFKRLVPVWPGGFIGEIVSSILSRNKSPSRITADEFVPRDMTLNIRMSKPGVSAIRYCQRGNKKEVWFI